MLFLSCRNGVKLQIPERASSFTSGSGDDVYLTETAPNAGRGFQLRFTCLGKELTAHCVFGFDTFAKMPKAPKVEPQLQPKRKAKKAAFREESILDAMMDDLGNNRMEAVAAPDGRDMFFAKEEKKAKKATKVIKILPPTPKKESTKPAVRSNRWVQAVLNGTFNDDDAAGVRGLSTLDDGQLARKRRLNQEDELRKGLGYSVRKK